MASTASSTQPSGCKGGGRNITIRIHPKKSLFVRVCGCLRMSADREYETDMSAALVCGAWKRCFRVGFRVSAVSAKRENPAGTHGTCLRDVCGMCNRQNHVFLRMSAGFVWKVKKIKGAWDIAYGAIAGARPKFHYALHLQEQIHRWRRHIDCFAGDRKHRVFKSIVAPRLTRLNCFTRSTLLQMTETELTTSHLESEYTGQLIGKPTQDAVLAMELGISPESFSAKGIQIYCVEYPRGSFVQMSATCCIEILHGLSNVHGFYVVVRKLQSFLAKNHYQMEAPIWRKDNPCSFYFDARGAYAFAPPRSRRSLAFTLIHDIRKQQKKQNWRAENTPRPCQHPCFQKWQALQKIPMKHLAHLAAT